MKLKQVISALLLCCIGLSALAQGKKPHFSKEEFRAKQQEYITQKAELTPQEAQKFFKLFFQLQDRKRKLNEDTERMIEETKKMSSDQTDYKAIINKIHWANMEADRLDREYVGKYREFMSDKKIYKTILAERSFHKVLLKSMKHPKQPNKSIPT